MSEQELPVTVAVQLPDGRIEQVPVGTAVRAASGYTVRLADLKVRVKTGETRRRTLHGREWLLDAIRYFRALHFFESHSDRSDDELANLLKRLEVHFAKSDGKDYDKDERTSRRRKRPVLFRHEEDWEVLRYDPDRVFEVYVGGIHGDGPYRDYDPVEQLKSYVGISRGAFQPADVSARRSKRGTPPGVSFTLAARRYTMAVWEDPRRMVEQLNPLIADSGYQFECVDAPPDVQVMTLTAEEKQRLQQERGWRFLPIRDSHSPAMKG